MALNVAALLRAYKSKKPNPVDPAQQVSFGTSGHRGTSTNATFNEAHVAAITQAICEYRGSDAGPLYIGMDTHALSEPAQRTAIEVLAANGVRTILQDGGGFTPTPVISRAILVYNEGREAGLADGIVVTPSHNPPPDGGFKYNPPTGGPAGGDVTGAIQKRANDLLRQGNQGVKRVARPKVVREDLVQPYVRDLGAVIDMDAIRASGLRIGADPLGGSSLAYWQAIRDYWRINITVTNAQVDPEFGFMPLDHDGKVRMDCSSKHAMARLLEQQDKFDVAFGNDPDADRHGIVTPSEGLLNPNWYLAVAVDYLLAHRPDWPTSAVVGKTVVSSSLIDRVTAAHGRDLLEVPVGFKYFAGLHDGSICFGGEESAGASFLRRNGRVWTTDKDGIIMGLLSAEIAAVTGRDPGEHYRALTTRFGATHYKRIDRPATPEIQERLKTLRVTRTTLAGNTVLGTQTKCGADSIGGVKVMTSNGWFAARPSGTENLYKLYTESFVGPKHRERIAREAEEIIRGD